MAKSLTECICTFAQRMVGDGCEVCNPSRALEYTKEALSDLQSDYAALAEAAGWLAEVEEARPKWPELSLRVGRSNLEAVGRGMRSWSHLENEALSALRALLEEGKP